MEYLLVTQSLLVAAVVAGLVHLFLKSRKHYSYFTNLGIPGPLALPLIGDKVQMMEFVIKGPTKTEQDRVQKYGRIYGSFGFGNAFLNVADAKTAKEIMIKQFNNFPDRLTIDAVSEKPFDKFLTNLRGDHWKHVRNIITPTFTSGKLKLMLNEINRCADSFVDAILKKIQTEPKLPIKEHTSRFTLDVIASAAFGLDIDAQNDTDSLFLKHARKFFEFEFTNPKLILLLTLPSLYNLLKRYCGLRLFDQEANEFFEKVVDSAMEARKNGLNQGRTDFLQLMIRADKHDLNKDELLKEDLGFVTDYSGTWTKDGLMKDEILSSAVLFLTVGYDTTAVTLAFLCYNLAMHQDVQQKLQDEIDNAFGDEELKKITYEQVNQLTYLECCINESLRVHTTAPTVNRVALNDCVINGIPIKKGTGVNLLLHSIHKDPAAYPDPDNFIPERFLPNSGDGRAQQSFLAFGMGPRNCVGMRLALLEVKIAAVKLLKKCNLLTCEETQIPPIFKKSGLLQTKKPLILKVEQRA